MLLASQIAKSERGAETLIFDRSNTARRPSIHSDFSQTNNTNRNVQISRWSAACIYEVVSVSGWVMRI